MTAYKQPSEQIPLSLDFSAVLPTGETVQSSSTVKIVDPDGADVTATMLLDSSTDDSAVYAIITGGTGLLDYKVTFTALTQNYKFEEDIVLKVREQ
ncbi:MAG: hypothetical protein EPO24_04050 [Bacteroidetes bacterium]|nr:MAG: hypothetical protein EPO24_04050 [Bacteroidota bacterium]